MWIALRKLQDFSKNLLVKNAKRYSLEKMENFVHETAGYRGPAADSGRPGVDVAFRIPFLATAWQLSD